LSNFFHAAEVEDGLQRPALAAAVTGRIDAPRIASSLTPSTVVTSLRRLDRES